MARLRQLGLSLWAIGALTLEGIASLGVALCLAALVVEVATGIEPLTGRRFLRQWAPLLAFVAWGLLAPLLAGRLPTGTGVGRHLDLLWIPLAAYSFVRLSASEATRVGRIAAAVFAGSCLAAGLQYFGLWPSPELFSGLEWTRVPFHRVYEPAPGALGRFMAGGLAFHRLRFAHVGALAVLVALCLGQGGTGRLRLALLGLAGAGLLSVLLFPMARGASAALVLSAAVALVLGASAKQRGRAAIFSVVLLLLTGLLALAHAPLRERLLASASSRGSGERGALLQTGIKAVLAHPLVGVGLGQFRPARFADASTPREVLDHPGKAHNQLVSMAAETGLPGVGLFVLLLLWLWRELPGADALGASGRAGIALFVLLGLLHDPLFHAAFGLGLALLLGAGLSRRGAERAPTSAQERAGTPPASSGHSPPR